MPGIGRKRDELARGIRSSTVAEYIVFYRMLDDELEIIHVLHGRRHLRRVFESFER